MIYVLVVFMQASGGAAGGKQGNSIANALDDITPQQVRGGSSKGYGCHMMAQTGPGRYSSCPGLCVSSATQAMHLPNVKLCHVK